MNSLRLDLKNAFIVSYRNWGSSILAIMLLALGLGINGTMFAIVYASLWRSLPYPKPYQLASIWSEIPRFGNFQLANSMPDLEDVQRQCPDIDGLATYEQESLLLTGAGAPQQLDSVAVSPNFFTVIGVPPLLGRIFFDNPTDNDANPMVILSYKLWRSTFGGASNVIGKSITVDGKQHLVVGVMPPQFDFPRGTLLWTPLVVQPAERVDRSLWLFSALVRLRPHATVKHLQTGLDIVAGRLVTPGAVPGSSIRFHAVSLQQEQTKDVRPALLLLLAATTFVFLIGCINAASLQLTRGIVRQPEFALRFSLGASRWHLFRLLMLEGLLLGGSGMLAGALLSTWFLPVLRSVLPPLPVPPVVHMGAPGWLFFIFGAMFGGVIFASLPLLFASTKALSLTGSKIAGAHRRGGLIRRCLVTVQVALAFLLLSCATLALRHLNHLLATPSGFRADHRLVVSMTFAQNQFASPELAHLFLQSALETERSLPGVIDAACAVNFPFLGGMMTTDFHLADTSHTPGASHKTVAMSAITPGFFHTLGIAITRGRDFNVEDGTHSPHVAMVDETFVHKYFGTASPLGKHILFSDDPSNAGVEIVGVVAGIRDVSPETPPAPRVYIPLTQWDNIPSAALVLTTPGDPSALAKMARERIEKIAPDQPMPETQTMAEIFDFKASDQKAHARLMTIFSILGTVLALAGIYGALNHFVNSQRKQFGVRMALGAQRSSICALVMRQTLRLTIIGVGAGLLLTLALLHWARSSFWGTPQNDPVVLASITGAFLLVSLVAGLLPAFSAMRTNPWSVLRQNE